METLDNIPKQLKTAKSAKRVRFAPDVKYIEKPCTEFAPYKKAKKEPNYARMRKNVLQLLAGERYEELKSYLNSYTSREIEEFCDKCGTSIFNSAILYADTSENLLFLLKNTSKSKILDILYKDNFDVIIGYVEITSRIDMKRNLTPAELELFSQQINLLLELKDEHITHAIKVIIYKEGISENIKAAVATFLPKVNNVMFVKP